jgi:hypothetical protein
VTSDEHSTVWNGDGLLFDHNFLALGVSPDECFEMARKGGEELAPGKYMRTAPPITPRTCGEAVVSRRDDRLRAAALERIPWKRQRRDRERHAQGCRPPPA